MIDDVKGVIICYLRPKGETTTTTTKKIETPLHSNL